MIDGVRILGGGSFTELPPNYKNMKTLLKLIYNIGSWIFLGAIFLIVIFTLGSNTNLLGGYKSFMVLSGSMEPTINIADIIIAHQQDQYVKNDVVTFYGEERRIVTHRIFSVSQENNQNRYTTKGDANRSEDDGSILQSAIIGKVIFVIPKLGYFVNFAHSIPGLIILIFIPVIALIIDQILKITRN